MKVLAGSVVVLAGCVLAAGGAVANGLTTAAQRSSAAPGLAMLGAAVLVLIGLGVMGSGWRPEKEPPP